jgi:hypothetical protein
MVGVSPKVMLAGGLAVAGVAFFYLYGKGGGGFMQDVGKGAAGAVIDLGTGIAAGTALGIGDAIGVPRTEKTKCQAAKDAGSRWEASLYCPAGEFLGFMWDSF